MKKDYEQAQAVVQVAFTDEEWFNDDDRHHGYNDYGGFHHSTAALLTPSCQRLKEMDALQEQRASERINSYRQQQQR
jgi:hypothetical protein